MVDLDTEAIKALAQMTGSPSLSAAVTDAVAEKLARIRERLAIAEARRCAGIRARVGRERGEGRRPLLGHADVTAIGPSRRVAIVRHLDLDGELILIVGVGGSHVDVEQAASETDADVLRRAPSAERRAPSAGPGPPVSLQAVPKYCPWSVTAVPGGPLVGSTESVGAAHDALAGSAMTTTPTSTRTAAPRAVHRIKPGY